MKIVSVLLAICITATHGINLYWRAFNGTVPAGAITPEDGLLIGQVIAHDAMLPGTFNIKTSTLTTMAHDVKIVVADENIKILCTSEHNRLYWEYVNVESLTGDKLKQLVVGGYEGSTLYIGKVFHENQWKIGKVFPPSSQWKGLNLWTDEGCCYKPMDFMILAYN